MCVRIVTYDSVPTDLAAEMRTWPEFVSGEGYSVRLREQSFGNEVCTRLVRRRSELPELVVDGPRGPLFDKVLGRVIQALLQHSDNLMVLGVPFRGDMDTSAPHTT